MAAWYAVAAAAAAGAVIKGFPAYTKAKMAAAEARVQSRILQIDAMQTRDATFRNEARFRKQKDRELASIVTAVGKSGVRMEGSALKAFAESSINAEQDALELRFNGLRKASRIDRQAKFGMLKAENINAAGMIDTLMKGVEGGVQGGMMAAGG